ncbi:MAG: MFS transporter [Rhodospirillales bacterium]
MDPAPLPSRRGSHHPPLSLSWLVWGVGATFYFIGFYQRVAPAVMSDRLMADFAIGAATLGHISAFYFYSYVAMQIPTGFLADLWGPRRLMAAGALVASAGTLMFALAPGVAWAATGRLLIGASVAVAWVALIKLASHWFPSRLFATITGMALFLGIAGGVSAGVPLRLLIDGFGWRPVMLGLAAVTLVQALALWLVVRDDPQQKGYRSYAAVSGGGGGGFRRRSMGRALATVLRARNTWLLTLSPGALVGSVTAFCGLWGLPFLTSQYHLPPTSAAMITSAGLIAWGISSPIMGGLSDRIGRRKPLYVATAATATLAWAAVAWAPGLPVWLLTLLVVTGGFAAGGIIIGFAQIKESVPSSLAGSAAGVCNMGVMAGPMLLQPVIGRVLETSWQGGSVAGVPIYDFAGYRAGFSLMAAWCLIATVLVACTRETWCRPLGAPTGTPAQGGDGSP